MAQYYSWYVTDLVSPPIGNMSRTSDSEDGCFVAMDTEDASATSQGVHKDEQIILKEATSSSNCAKHPGKSCQRAMGELPEEVLEYILSFLSPYQEHKTAALVCKQWYRLIKGEGVWIIEKREKDSERKKKRQPKNGERVGVRCQ